MAQPDRDIVDFINTNAASERYGAYLRDTLVELVNINTVPDEDVAGTAARERQVWDVVEREVKAALGAGVVVERPPINPAIAADTDYSQPGYAARGGRVPDVREAYAGRTNLQVVVGGAGGAAPRVILNAHADVVGPWFGARVDGPRVFGRGACDDKAQMALLLAQMKLLRELEEKFGRTPAGGRVYQFVIDEEMGGNGSLSAALDPRFVRLPVLVHETCGLVPYCAHRGAVWYRCKLAVGQSGAASAVEIFPFVVLALEEEGRKIKEETRHPLFTQAHVQTNHGVLGPCGAGPSRVCDHVAVEVTARSKANPERVAMKVIEFFEEAAGMYVRLYGDKTREKDPVTGKFKVARHFDVKVTPTPDTTKLRIDVYGKSGHMAKVGECDGAITRAAFLFAGLVKAAAKYPQVEAVGRLVGDTGDGREVLLEGGQGFTPAHKMADVQARMTAAAQRGVQKYCKHRGRQYDPAMVTMTFERLHNDAYADAPNSPPMQALTSACAALGQAVPKPMAWEASCDARIYHHKGHPVAIFGAGPLEHAHADTEYVDIPEVQRALAISTLAVWSMIA